MVTESTDLIKEYLEHLALTVSAISHQEISAVVQVLFIAWRDGHTVFLCGNGGSATVASHMANDLNKYTIVAGKPRLKAIALTDNIPVITAWANDTDYANIFSEQLLNLANSKDVVIAISTSGNSHNIVRALEVARDLKIITIGFTGKFGGKLKNLVDYCIFIPDDHIGRQEDGHIILDHVIAHTLQWMIANEGSNLGDKT